MSLRIVGPDPLSTTQRSRSRCKVCGEEDHLVPCYICMEWFCPKHRVCEGDIGGAVYCAEHHEYISTPEIERKKDLEVEQFIRTARRWSMIADAISFFGIVCLSAAATIMIVLYLRQWFH